MLTPHPSLSHRATHPPLTKLCSFLLDHDATAMSALFADTGSAHTKSITVLRFLTMTSKFSKFCLFSSPLVSAAYKLYFIKADAYFFSWTAVCIQYSELCQSSGYSLSSLAIEFFIINKMIISSFLWSSQSSSTVWNYNSCYYWYFWIQAL